MLGRFFWDDEVFCAMSQGTCFLRVWVILYPASLFGNQVQQAFRETLDSSLVSGF